jgi:uncharacterized membrane protein YqjE
MSPEAGRSTGLLDSLRRAGATLVEIVYTRLELLATEFEDERARIARALWLAAIGALCLATSALLAVAFVVVLFWDTYRLQAIGVLACGFGLAGILTLLALRKLMTERPRLFSQSLAELRTDRDQLSK